MGTRPLLDDRVINYINLKLMRYDYECSYNEAYFQSKKLTETLNEGELTIFTRTIITICLKSYEFKTKYYKRKCLKLQKKLNKLEK